MFNPIIDNCDLPSNYKCGKLTNIRCRRRFASDAYLVLYEIFTGHSICLRWSVLTDAISSVSEVKTTTPKPATTPDSGIQCPRSQGLFSHPTDCHLFVHCDHDTPYVKECPANLHFNPTLMVRTMVASAQAAFTKR